MPESDRICYCRRRSLQNAVEPPPKFVGGWAGSYTINAFVVVWVLLVGFGFGGWASMANFVHQIDTFGLFAKCYQCPPPPLPPTAAVPSPTLPANATAAGPLPHPHRGEPVMAPSPSPSHLGLHRHRHHRHHSP